MQGSSDCDVSDNTGLKLTLESTHSTHHYPNSAAACLLVAMAGTPTNQADPSAALCASVVVGNPGTEDYHADRPKFLAVLIAHVSYVLFVAKTLLQENAFDAVVATKKGSNDSDD